MRSIHVEAPGWRHANVTAVVLRNVSPVDVRSRVTRYESTEMRAERSRASARVMLSEVAMIESNHYGEGAIDDG
jgi:hypothetical protein